MEIEERKVDIDGLTLGMFVSRLDRPWEGTPFALQGLSIDSPADIDRLRRYCRYVYIDVEKSGKQQRSLLQRMGYGALTRNGRPLPPSTTYANRVSLAEELPQAREAWNSARAFATRVIDDVRAGRRLSVDALNGAMEPIVASVIRNADAYFWLDALRKRDAYSYSHAVNCCALATSFGRHLGFPREMLVDLASAGMLMDIGKTALPENLLQRAGPLRTDELPLVRAHVDHSLSMLDQAGIISVEIGLMIRGHHERHDGSGYPDGRTGAETPLTARMLGLVDTYDALSSDRPHQKALARHDVLQVLYRERDKLFQADLIEQFSQSLGVYPTGSLVELSSGEVAVVMAQNPARRLYPRVTVLTARDKSLDPAFRQVDLWPLANAPDRSERIWIERALPPGAYGLDTSELYL
jgi:HD-GYP domain-containing protein (c-di-GMP phosphodiesterase class II)